jgi:hypothetical protein
LVRESLVYPLDELLDSLWLIAGGRETRLELEGSLVLFHAKALLSGFMRPFLMVRPATIP